ncbi:hypothetical protein JYT87_03105 [Nitrospira defluvii]|nr:hypothetical protein [Nitrospira defluvii]
MGIEAEISPGELFDKITILEIKLERISDEVKLANVRKEHTILTGICDKHLVMSESLFALVKDLKAANETLWSIEDDIRDCERRKDFGQTFVVLARSVYINNDRRATLKKKINELLHSNLFEEKSYQAY